ncbi:MAG: AAA family ATPase [Promethearchaeota archaeon]
MNMHGFKSFGNRTVSVNLAKGFTCVIGPNGNGKSNIVDSLTFGLGRISKKTMRAKSLTDLIFAGAKGIPGASRAEVDIVFDNKNREFPSDFDEYKISRFVTKKGTGGYKIDGKKCTRELILNSLAQANIDPDGSQFILQGKVVELTHMSSVARRNYIETLIGLSKYDKMKAQTLKELEKADSDLRQFEAIFKEVSQQLKKVEKERDVALRWQELNDQIQHYNAQLIALKISKRQIESDEIDNEIESNQMIIEELEGKINRQKEKIEAEATYLKSIEEEITGQDEERVQLDEKLTTQKSTLSAKEATLKATEEHLKRLEQNITRLEELQTALENDQSYDDLISATQNEIDEILTKIDEHMALIDETVSDQKEKESQIAGINSEKTQINKEISSVKQEIKALTTEVKMLEKSIKKNEKKRSNLEIERDSLKTEDQSVSEALDEAKEEVQNVLHQIDKLKTQIQEKKDHQRDLDHQIQEEEEKRSNVAKIQSDNQATLSSIGAEINLLDSRISELEEKKKQSKSEYDRLTNGKPVEEQISALKTQEEEKNKALKENKDALNKANEDQKRSQFKKDSIDAKRRTLEGELGDLEKRLSGLKVELRNCKNEKNLLERDQNQLNMQKQGNESELTNLKDEQKKLGTQIDGFEKKRDHFIEEREKIQVNIDKQLDEQEKNSSELENILNLLTEISQNIDRSAGDIKSDIQNVSQVAVDKSSTVFEQFMLDIRDIMTSFQEITETSGSQMNEMKEQLQFAADTLKLLIDNTKEPLDQMNDDVQEATDEALQESMANFDGFIRDFMDKFDSIRIAIQATAVSDTTELYRNLDDINENIQSQNQGLSQLNNDKTKIDLKIEQLNQNQKKLENSLKEIENKLKDNKERTNKHTSETDEKNKRIEEIREEIKNLDSQLNDIKSTSENFWKINKDYQTEIDSKSEELKQITSDLNSLSNVKHILDTIENMNKEQEQDHVEIEKKQQNILDVKKSEEKLTKDLDTISNQINQLKTDRQSADDARSDLQIQIDAQNDVLSEFNGRIKDLENIQKIIDEIETLTQENSESKAKIESNSVQKDELEEKIKEFDKNIQEKDKKIASLQEERQNLETKEKELRKTLQDINREKNQLDKKLDVQNQMKERADEIEGLKDECGALGDDIADLQEEIQAIISDIESLEEERSNKLQQITDLQSQKSESWEKQKNFRDDLGIFNADLSRNQAKLNNLETRKLVLTEKIDDLFEKSKDYGTLPPVTDDLIEENLTNNINKASNEKKALEPVNLKSIDEYEVVKERWDEIDMRRQTLQRERKSILDSLDRIELEKTRTFMKAYHEINRVFSEVFMKLSPGGSAKMMLDDPAHPFEGGISIEARPRGKKISSLEILSGGEKTLVALSFIFAIQNFYPAPFYVMDEIDAALDGPNVYRVSMVIKEYAQNCQFIVISHREENITNAERIYGVSMTNGITDVFTVNLEDEKQRGDFNAEVEIAGEGD